MTRRGAGPRPVLGGVLALMIVAIAGPANADVRVVASAAGYGAGVATEVAVRPGATAVQGSAAREAGFDAARDEHAAGEGAGPQTVSGERLDELTRQVGSQLRCVVCQGVSIEDSPSELAQRMKSVVREQLAVGRSPEQVKRYFVETYGEWILLEPPPDGFNLAVYLLPVLALTGGAGVVIVAVRRWTRSPGDGAPSRGDGG